MNWLGGNKQMDVSRRSFLRGAMALTAVTIAQPSMVLASVPTIYGDGIHDDHAGLQALIDGKPFRVQNEASAFQASSGIIRGGTFAIGDTLVIRGNGILIDFNRIQSLPGFRGQYMVFVEKDAVGAITNCYFDARHVKGAAIIVQK